jgi:hypothetical protein
VVGDSLRDSTFLTVFYYLALGGLMRTARRRRARGEARPGVIALDEWFVLSRNPYLARRVVELVKTARNLRVALWLAEQDLATFTGHETVEEVQGGGLTGHHLLANMSYWLAFQKSAPRRGVPREFAGAVRRLRGLSAAGRAGRAWRCWTGRTSSMRYCKRALALIPG